MINEFKTEATTEAKASATTSEATTATTETAMSEQTTATTTATTTREATDSVATTATASPATASATPTATTSRTASATAKASAKTNAANVPDWLLDLTPMNLEVSTQFKNHTVRSITNLINTIYTWGPFISIITGADFKADKSLVNTINKREFESREELLAYVKEQTERGVGLTGVRCEEGKNSNKNSNSAEADGEVIFDGFKGVPFANNCGTYSRLMFHINKNALERKSIKARDLTDEEMRDGRNTFAAWLTSIGMKKDDANGVFVDDRERLLTLVDGVMKAVRARAARRAAAAKAAEDKAVAQTAAAGM